MENQMQDDLRSHVSHFSGVAGKVGKARSIADGQSQHSFSNHSQRGYLGTAFPTNLVNSRPGKFYWWFANGLFKNLKKRFIS